MFVGDLLDDRQPQARAFGLGGNVRLEGALEDVLGKPATMVQHAQAYPCAAAAAVGAQHHGLDGATGL